MTILLKSDKTLPTSNSKDAIERDLSPVLSIDAVNNKYTLKGSDVVNINELVTANSRRVGWYDEGYGYNSMLNSDQVVISNHPLTYKKGILVEGEASNFFSNPLTPATQVVTLITAGSSRVARFRVSGSGSIKITNNTTKKFIKEVTECHDLYMQIDATSSSTEKSYLVEVVGKPSFVEVSVNNSNRYILTKTESKITSSLSAVTKLELKSNLANLLTRSLGSIFLKISLSPEMFIRYGRSMTYYPLKIAGEDTGISVGFVDLDGSARAIFSTLSGVSIQNSITSDFSFDTNESISFALNFNDTGTTLYCNGKRVGTIDITLDITDYKVYLGSTPNWITYLPHLIEEFIIFDEQLAEDELIQITSL